MTKLKKQYLKVIKDKKIHHDVIFYNETCQNQIFMLMKNIITLKHTSVSFELNSTKLVLNIFYSFGPRRDFHV